MFHCSTGPLFHWCVDIFTRSLEKLVDEPLKSNVRLGEYAGEESLEADEGDGGPCCFHGVEPGGDNVCGTTFLTTEIRIRKSKKEKKENQQKMKTKTEFIIDFDFGCQRMTTSKLNNIFSFR